MELIDLIKETEALGILVLFTNLATSKGRHSQINGQKIIFLDQKLDDIEAINILLHERQHCLSDDIHNTLAISPSYSHRIENITEKNRILDFFNLINTEYPIDESFNYLSYMKSAHVPNQYENFIKELAQKTYNKNQEKEK